MPLTEEEIRSIGSHSAIKVLGKCTDLADFMIDQLETVKEDQNNIMFTLLTPKKAQREMLFQLNSHIETVKEFYPDFPVRVVLLDKLGHMKTVAEHADKNNPESAIKQVAEEYEALHNQLRDIFLHDFTYCACGELQEKLDDITGRLEDIRS